MKYSLRTSLRRLIFDLTPEFIKHEVQKPYIEANLSYAQEGEDMILDRFLNSKTEGFYVDVGAHHPIRFSNTYYFYKRGWQGINIDAMPGSMKSFDEIRPNDINLEVGVGKGTTLATFFIFNEPALNTFSETEALAKDQLKDYFIVDRKSIRIQSIKDILDKYLPAEQIIDFLSIDAEGKDLEVLESNDWHTYRPSFVLVEDLQRTKIESMIRDSQLYHFMINIGYQMVAKSYNTLFFQQAQ